MKKFLCLLLSLTLLITLLPSNLTYAAPAKKSHSITIKINSSRQQLAWESLNTSISASKFQEFDGAVTIKYNFEVNDDKPGCTP